MLLSIIVLSYNRPNQIRRILDNLVNVNNSEFNLIIKDDQSPRKKDIVEIVNHYKPKLNFNIIFYSNEKNLGYDLNLLDSFRITNAKFVFLLSDDDFIDGSFLPQLISYLKKTDAKICFTPYNQDGKIKRNYNATYDINKFQNIIYNSILFSGLIFNRETVLSIDKNESFLATCIYTQVYLSSVIIFNEKSFGVAPEGILYLGGDGENFFGKNQSAQNKSLLSDRKKTTSNLNYQKLLIKTVKETSSKTNDYIYITFIKEYKKRLIAYAFNVRSIGIKDYKIFFEEYKKFDTIKTPALSIILNLLFIIPKKLSAAIYNIGIILLRKSG